MSGKSYKTLTRIESAVQDVDISSTTKMTDTPFTLAVGETATFTYVSGDWGIWGDGRRSGPAGGYAIAHNGGPNGPWPAPGAFEGCMVVYVGGAYYDHFTGNSYSMSGTGARVSLGPNDNKLDDNNGSITIRITVNN